MEYHSGGSLPLLGRPRYCPGANANGGYLCETGHCCGESGCCTYYYELWWFWLLWTVLILFSCCCAYRHRRAKLRVQQQQRQRDISLLAYQGAASFPSSMLDLSFLASLKLPSYEEVAAQPSTPPPPYSSVFTAPRYPQPPRAAHPHLLSQHPGPAQLPGAPHRSVQPLSDGPSSLSSDNSSSCSCDSCCPSSPCSSSLSAPVTYETDTSHASTPSEAAPLALDAVALETISAAAARLGSKDPPPSPAAVAILIERETKASLDPQSTEQPCPDTSSDPARTPENTSLQQQPRPAPQQPRPAPQQPRPAPQQPSPAPQQPRPAPQQPRPAPQQPRPAPQQPRPAPLILDSAGGDADRNPSLVPVSASPPNPNPPRAALPGETHDPSVPAASPNTSPAHAHTSPAHASPPPPPPPPSGATNRSPKFADRSSPSQGIAHFPLEPAGEPSERTTEGAPSVAKQSEEGGHLRKSPSATAETTLMDTFQTVELSESTELLAANAERANEEADTSAVGTQSLSQTERVSSPLESPTSCELSQNSKSQAATSSPAFSAPKLTQDPSVLSLEAKSETPAAADTREVATAQPRPSQPTAESVSITMPEPSNSECPPASPSQDAPASSRETVSPSPPLHAEIPPETTPTQASPSLTDVVSPALDREAGKLFATKPVNSELLPFEQTVAGDESSVNVMSPISGRETGKTFATNPVDPGLFSLEHSNPRSSSFVTTEVSSPTSQRETKPAELLNLERSSANVGDRSGKPTSPDASSSSAFPPPAITVQADPPSFAASPCSIPSSSPPQSPSGAAPLQPCAASSSSSLSPSPRNTQSPPKQTLFSPCVDVFEPVDPSWEEEEEEEGEEGGSEEGQNDEEDGEEDSDLAADESQYRHRRLTGDSGIEVCRCRVEEEEEEEEDDNEEEEEEEMEKAKIQDGGERLAELHDSVDCPARSRRGSLCNGEPGSEKVAIPVETV